MVKTRSGRLFLPFTLFSCFSQLIGPTRPAPSTGDFSLTPISTYTNSHYWTAIELLRDSNPHLTQETFINDTRQKTPEIVAAFGNNSEPGSQYFLLHYAPGWNTATQPYPVLLVPGASFDADMAFANPLGNGTPGLMQYLINKGYAAFAVTFANTQGDNWMQSGQIANAIKKIKSVTAATKVDLIAHSKGNVPARMYVANLHKSWGTAYRGNVRRLIQLGAPNKGLDFSFRDTDMNWAVLPDGANSPVPYISMLIDGVWINTAYHSLYTDFGNAFPGQSQLLYRWDNIYPLNETQQDWYTTYYGGQGFCSYSKGIDHAIKEGGNLISTLNRNGVDPGVQVAILSGDNNVINGVVWEDSGPSDGIIFVKSATYTVGITLRGAQVIANDTYDLNHVELLYAPSAMSWVNTQLGRT
ncbi:MAG: hypothetical protein M0Z41_17095 [Peptococcaceae bacterium]|jgi:hypothetical protein|nr:hypothetical protein [Peptococcaceae bacterium]